ncbi:MAG: hypothetical protein ABSC89_15620 [Verrucomicrobiota bacterium]|jgi:predicted MPP superfamily phosphohydrolase
MKTKTKKTNKKQKPVAALLADCIKNHEEDSKKLDRILEILEPKQKPSGVFKKGDMREYKGTAPDRVQAGDKGFFGE